MRKTNRRANRNGRRKLNNGGGLDTWAQFVFSRRSYRWDKIDGRLILRLTQFRALDKLTHSKHTSNVVLSAEVASSSNEYIDTYANGGGGGCGMCFEWDWLLILVDLFPILHPSRLILICTAALSFEWFRATSFICSGSTRTTFLRISNYYSYGRLC